MARYIDADRLINEISGNGGVFVYGAKAVAAIVSRINAQPTADVVEVVRCGNCLNRIKGTYPKCQGRKPDDYCSDGIRKE